MSLNESADFVNVYDLSGPMIENPWEKNVKSWGKDPKREKKTITLPLHGPRIVAGSRRPGPDTET